MHRRSFIATSVASIALGRFGGLLQAAGRSDRQPAQGFGEIVPDAKQILDLPRGFRYQVVSVQGQSMDDGLKVPGWPDGMHAFMLDKHRVVIMCNHV